MVPLMIVSSISFAVSKQFETHSMDVKALADKGQVFTTNKDRNILGGIDILEVICTDIPTISPAQKPEDVVTLLAGTTHSHFAVVDERKRLIGIIDFDNVRSTVFNAFQIKYTKIEELMTQPADIASVEDSVETIMDKFDLSQTSYLPILKDDRYYGFVYKEKMLEAYRQKLKEMVIE